MRTLAGDRAQRGWTGAIGSAVARRGVLGGLLVLALLTAACSSASRDVEEADDAPSPTESPSPSPSSSPSPSPSPVSPIPDGRYAVTLTDPEETFFDEAPAEVVLTLDQGEYSLQEEGIQFESGVYWGVDDHVEFDAGVGPCSGAESFHEYDWTLHGDKLRFVSEGGQICSGRLILFTENVWRALD
jgi:hypothetical protein